MKIANNAPTYIALYPKLAELAKRHGYALAVHGSCVRDLDLIAIPWTDNPSDPQSVINDIVEEFAIDDLLEWTDKPHGRRVKTLSLMGDWFFDIGFMPIVVK